MKSLAHMSNLKYKHGRVVRYSNHKEGILNLIDNLRGVKVDYMHHWDVSEGTIKKVKGEKIYISDGYKLRRLDISLTCISHPAVIAYLEMADSEKMAEYLEEVENIINLK